MHTFTAPPSRSVARSLRAAGIRLLVLAAIALASPMAIAQPVKATGDGLEHLVPALPDGWTATYRDDDEAHLWTYAPPVGADVPFDEITVSAHERASMPLTVDTYPRQVHALAAAYQPDAALEIRKRGPGWVLFEINAGQTGGTRLLCLMREGTTLVHTAELELDADTPQAEVDRWAAVLADATLVPAR